MRVLDRRIARQRIDGDPSIRKRPTSRPEGGWVRAIREALGMSEVELAVRMGVSQQRVDQIQRAEAARSIRLATLISAAEALQCELVYYFAPREPLEDMVWRQAYAKAAEEVGYDPDDPEEDLRSVRRGEEAEALTPFWVDHRGLWKRGRSGSVGPTVQPPASAGPVPASPLGPPPGFP